MRPVVRVDNWLIWPDGYSRPMTVRELLQWRIGKRRFER